MEKDIQNLIKKIKEKPELSGLSDEVVAETIKTYSKKRRIILDNLSKSGEKIVAKDIRAELRQFSGMFQTSKKSELKKRKEFLEKNKILELLKTHSSTKERIEGYPVLIEKILSLNPKSILDLGCGLNPIAIVEKLPSVKYYASDIREDELAIIKEFFRKNKISGETFIYNLRKLENPLPSADLCILFKVLDSIESKGHKQAEKLIKKLQCRFILISFPSIKLSGRQMNQPRRFWLENLLNRLNIKFSSFKISNEIFYLAEK